MGAASRVNAEGVPDQDLAKRPAHATGSVTLSIPPKNQVLTVVPTPAKDALEPGASTSVDVMVTDVSGQPVKDAEVTLIVVDEAILALVNHGFSNPLWSLFTGATTPLFNVDLRALVYLVNPDEVAVPEDDAFGGADTAEMEAGLKLGMVGVQLHHHRLALRNRRWPEQKSVQRRAE